jgi:DNA-dependent protein kinase catalytic subunit
LLCLSLFQEPMSPSSASLPVVHVDPVTGLLPSVPRDFQIFINLVDLCRSLLPEVDAAMFEQWVLPFGREVIVASSSHPLVSGFYKLLGTCLTLCKKIGYFQGVEGVKGASSSVAMETDESTERMTCYMLFRKFIREVVVRMKQYKDDLLVSCLQLLLSLPNELVKPEFSNLVPALQMTFKLGLSYLPLAKAGLAALQAWSSHLPPSVVNPHFRGILPALDDYLKTRGFDEGQGDGGGVKLSRHSTGRLISIKNISKWRESTEGSESPHRQIRMRILHFLGSLGGHVNASLVERDSAAVHAKRAVAWDSEDHLVLDLPFQDLKTTICLDPFLPRVCELASTSSDRQTKIAACELLHAMVLFILGRSAQPAMQKKSPMTKLFRKVFPYLLQMGCDVEKVAEQLFRPLVLQMIHWFTRNTQYESPDTVALLDAILDGIVDSSDTALRDFCGLCVREFLIWSIRQTSKKQQEKSPINMKSLLKRLYSLSSHPSASKRLGAALAFNNIYTVFREEESLVDMFVIEMLVVLIHSLKMAHRDEKSLGTQDQCVAAIGHIARIIRVKSALLVKTNKRRRLPKGLKTADLFSVVSWLLGQCGSPETACRHQCRTLFEQLAPLVPETLSAGIWIRRTVESEGGHYFVSRFEKGGHVNGGLQSRPTLEGKVFSLTDTCAWLDLLHAALDCYNWVFNQQLLSPSEVFPVKPAKQSENLSCLFPGVEQFLSKLALHGLEGASQCYESSSSVVHTPREVSDYNSRKCAVTLALLRFVTVLLTRHPKEAFGYVPQSFWGRALLEVVVVCCLQPSSAGFDVGDVALTESLTVKSMECLSAIHECKNFPTEQKSLLLELVGGQLSSGGACNLIGQLPLTVDDGCDKRDHGQLNAVTHGHILLQKSGLLPLVLEKMGHTEEAVVSKLLQSVLATVRPLLVAVSGSVVTATLRPVSAQTGSLFLQLALLLGVKPSALVDLLLDYSTDCPGLGLMVYQCFHSHIDDYIASHHQETVSLLLGKGQSKVETVSTILTGVLEHSGRDKGGSKREKGSGVCLYLISQWREVEGWWKPGQPDHLLAAINLLRNTLSVDPCLLQNAPSGDVNQVVTMYTAVLEDKQISLTFKSQALEVLNNFIGLSEEIQQKLRESLDRMIAYQCPLKSTEFVPGSPQYNEYISVIDKLLNALVVSGSCVLLEVLMNVMCREKRHAHEDSIQNSLTLFMKEIPTASEKKKAIDVSCRFFTNEKDYPLDGRRAAAERVCVPLMRACDEVALREFFLDHVGEIMAVIEAPLSKSTLESQLVCKLCSFNFMEVLYTRLSSGALSSPDSKINRAYCKGIVKTGKEMTQAVTKAGHQAKGEDVRGDGSRGELRRQYHCAAFNMVAAVITCTQRDLKFYTAFLFKEDLTKGAYLWDNLIDPERVYKFELELETPIDRKKQLTAIRNERLSPDSRESSSPPEDSISFPPRYLSSQYLADSSLSTDVSKFDFSAGPQVFPVMGTTTKSENKEMSYTVSEEQIEQDELNQHECMLPLMRLIDHMQHNKITPEVPQGSVPDELPSWMACIQKKLLDTRPDLNVQLFLARLITHRPKVFQPYAKYWLPCLINLVLRNTERAAGMQYFVVDVVVTLLSWASTAIPQEGDETASRLLEYLMHNCHHDNRSVFRNNLEIVKTLMELWRDRLTVPTKVVFNHFCNPSPDVKSNRTGIQLLGVVVANHLSPYDPDTAGAIDEQRFYTTFASLMSHKYKEIYAAAAEVMGMVLTFLQDKNHLSLENMRELVVKQLLSLCSGGNEDKFLICLNKIQINFPHLVSRFVEKLLFMLPVFHGVFRSLCLEVLLTQADVRATLYRELKEKGFHDMLKFRDEPTQLAALNICQAMLRLLELQQMAELLPLLREFSRHSSQNCRVVMYDIFIWTYNNTCSSSSGDECLKRFTSEVRDQLLLGLADDSEDIRLKMFAFWNEESRLASNTLGRLTQLLAVLYSTSTERHFICNSTNLLLELTSRSPDYNRSIFDQPLSDCKFEEYKGIDLSWQQRYSQMTPLFAATLSSQTGQTQTDYGGTVGSVGAGGLRATQRSVEFTPTQDGGGYNWMAPSLQSLEPGSLAPASSGETQSSSSSLLFNLMRPPRRPLRPVRAGDGFGVGTLGADQTDSASDPKEQKRMEIMKLKRRFLKDRKVTSAFFAKSQSRQKTQREETRKRQKAARSSKVVMYRKYRVGELPDTQIKYSEIIRPFQALAQRDNNLARMLFSILYCSLFGLVVRELGEEEGETAVAAIRDGLNAVLTHSTDYHPPFIGSLHDLCFHKSELELEPTAVSRACLDCMQEPIGIMLLEKQLLVNGESAAAGSRSTKRARTSTGAPPDHSTITWVEMSRLYKSLGDYDTLRGIFSSQVGVKAITKEALAAEERTDYVEALRLYKEAVGCENWGDGQPSQVEEDLWEDSMLQCYSHLTDWKDLEKAVVVNIENEDGSPSKLDKIWEDSYHKEHYLPHLMRAKLKLACSDVEDSNFTDFLNRSLGDPERKVLLETRHSTELALYSIIRGDLDRAKYYNNHSLQMFLQDWSSLDMLLVNSRSAKLQELQLLTEIQEFIHFMTNSGVYTCMYILTIIVQAKSFKIGSFRNVANYTQPKCCKLYPRKIIMPRKFIA